MDIDISRTEAAAVPSRASRPSENRRGERRASSEPGAAPPAPGSPSVAAAVERAAAVTLENRSIEFSFNKKINRVVVKVKTADTGEVVRQIPPEEYIQFAARFRELLGVLFSKTA